MAEQLTSSTTQKIGIRPVTLRSLRKVLVGIVLLVALAFGLLLSGLVAFTGYVMVPDDGTLEAADAIVVVTGGSGRLQRAIDLYKQGLGEKLLISGVHANYSKKYLASHFNLTEEEMTCCIDLDHLALNTVANATQTAIWAKENRFDSLIIVTSAYHMPRTMLEMRRAAPELNYQSHTISIARDRSLFARLVDLDNIQLLTKEYGKLLAAILHGSSERLHSGKS